jgi:hypothetical protein
MHDSLLDAYGESSNQRRFVSLARRKSLTQPARHVESLWMQRKVSGLSVPA